MGIAGTSRSQTPEWMDEHLPRHFSWLKQLGARFCHYKVCSTFDSAPHVGNIGRAIEIGRRVFGQSITPLVVGAPQLKRYTAFGHLFAGYQGETYRIDRHPVMSRHPVTPMDEADLRRHLARQTELPVDLVPAERARRCVGRQGDRRGEGHRALRCLRSRHAEGNGPPAAAPLGPARPLHRGLVGRQLRAREGAARRASGPRQLPARCPRSTASSPSPAAARPPPPGRSATRWPMASPGFTPIRSTSRAITPMPPCARLSARSASG